MKRSEAIDRIGVNAGQFQEYIRQYKIETHYHHVTGTEFFHAKDIEQLAIALIEKKADSIEESTDDDETLATELKKKAIEISNGHYSIFSFTNHYQGLYGTYENHYNFKDWLNVSPAFSTIEELLVNMIDNWQQHIVGDAALKQKIKIEKPAQEYPYN